jgi:hypothetical protein
MFTLISGESRKLRLRSGMVIAGLSAVIGAAFAQTSETSPGLYDLGTGYADFAGRASLEFDPPTRSNVWIIGNGSILSEEGTRATNPWASVLGQPQAFELDYNLDTGDLAWTVLGVTINANYFLQAGYGLAYIQPSIKVQTPAGAVDNTGLLSDLAVSVNGNAADNYGPWSVSGNGFDSGVIYLTTYDVHTIKITGNITFDIPEAWSDDINGTYADIELLSAKPVPEPASMAVLGVGLIAALKRRKKKSA